MRLSAKGAAFVRAHEGFRSNLYLDPVGIPTIGVGFTWRSTAFRKWWQKNKPGVKFQRGASMTQGEADDALMYLFDQEYGAAVNKFLGKDVPQHVFDAMASMTFNCGPGALKWSWAKFAKQGNYREAARRLKTTAVTAQGVRLNGLVRRRKEEAELLLNGVYKGVSVPAAPADAMSDNVLRRGERGPAVAKLIADLHALGYYDGALDDMFGRGTEAAVLDFQRTSGLHADGLAGPQTLSSIAAAIKAGETRLAATMPATAQAVIDDAAHTGRMSTEKAASGLGGAAVTISLIRNVAEDAGGALDAVSDFLPAWVVPVLLIGGIVAFAFTWWKRNARAKRARAAKAGAA